MPDLSELASGDFYESLLRNFKYGNNQAKISRTLLEDLIMLYRAQHRDSVVSSENVSGC